MSLESPRGGGPHLSPRELEQRRHAGVPIIDVREPVEYAAGHIPGSRNIPLASLSAGSLPSGPLVLVCQSGGRSARGLARLQPLRQAGANAELADLAGGLKAWQDAGLPLEGQQASVLPLMQQVQIAAGSLVLLGVLLSATLAPGWIALSAFVGAGLVFAGLSGSCAMAHLLAAMPWNRVRG
jgi:rhodanese-related sulfurtransferase